mmetsp:Transcript_154295/g.280266  ORF Transcript_154295/g.280266 Transcript_154295/m.280266 type:complete len:83 (+) Transcript_154295:71-319(+)
MGNRPGNGDGSKPGAKNVARLPVTFGDPQAMSKIYRDESQILFPVHAEGDVVEYYSPTHKVWMIGVIKLELIENSEGEPEFV